MITSEQKQIVLNNMIRELDLPDSAYEKAQDRYNDLGEWFDRADSVVSKNNPHIFPQGSFRLGTVIRPIDKSEEYDLDLACKLQEGINKEQHSQEQLKNIIGNELSAYRKARGISKNLEAKHRCWRLEYQDDLSFHMDIVPCIPADKLRRTALFDSILSTGLNKLVANDVSQKTVSITDDREQGFTRICSDWKISNPEGYAAWFEYRMDPQRTQVLLEKAQVDEVPLFKRKTPLQRVIQLLKRHRDNWVQRSEVNVDSKPISIIITTLAARAYNSEPDIASALLAVLDKMEGFIQPTRPRIPNPVDPGEDFADRWYRSDSLNLKLEENFNAWLLQAKVDFQHITATTDSEFLCKQMEEKFSLLVNQEELEKQLEVSATTVVTQGPKSHIIDKRNVAKPWQS